MSSASSLLLTLLLAVIQFALSVDARGGKGGKGGKGSKGSKKGSKIKHVVFEENGKCYDEHHVEITCPAKKNTALIVGIIVGVIVVILILVLAIWLYKRRSQKKNKKALNDKSRGIDDASSDRESIVPLVREETKEYGYDDKSMHA